VAEFLLDYGLFLAKVLTFGIVVLVLAGLAVASRQQRQHGPDGRIEVKKINTLLDDMEQTLEQALLDPYELKQRKKHKQKQAKQAAKQAKQAAKQASHRISREDTAIENASSVKGAEPLQDKKVTPQRMFVIDFDGDVRASAVTHLRHTISAILTVAKPCDEVVLRLDSGGGMVHAYGLAASQLQRLREHDIPLTVCVDKVAASGGYMMACMANRILAAPFAVIGSIGVVAQVPNFHRMLKKHDIDMEVLTAGEHKRSLTMLGENTRKGRDKFIHDLEQTHVLFRDFVARQRPQLDMDQVANGDVWYGQQAIALQLVDELTTSDEYLQLASHDHDLFLVSYIEKKNLMQKMSLGVAHQVEQWLRRGLDHLRGRYWH
jgi:serine protease SohB